MNTSLRVKRLIAYVYDLCARSGSCIQVSLCVQIGLLRTYTTCGLEVAYAYEYVFARKAAFLQRLGYSLTWQWQSFWMLSDSSDVAMTAVIDSIWFVWRWYNRRDGWYLIRPTLRWLLLLCDRLDRSPQRIRPRDAILWSLLSNDPTFRLDRLCRLVFRVPPQSSFDVIFRWSVQFLTLTAYLMMSNN